MDLSEFMIGRIGFRLTFVIALVVSFGGFAFGDDGLTLWHDYPAKVWESDIFPIGNGEMGAMIYGGIGREEIQFNVDSLWTGDDNPSGDYASMGAYQNFGSVVILFDGGISQPRLSSPCGHKSWHETESAGVTAKADDGPQQYRRSLDLSTALHTVGFERGGVEYKRESFVSAVDSVLVSEMTASKKGSYSGTITIKDAHGATCVASGNVLTVSGTLNNDLQYEGQLLLKHVGGAVSSKDGKLIFDKCDSLVLYLACGTDYVLDYSRGFKGVHPYEVLVKRIQTAGKQQYGHLRQNHIKDHQALFNRVSIDLGDTPKAVSGLSLDKRIKAYVGQPDDRDLEEMLFQYGRYLLIGSSRATALPANLQGVWNHSNNPPWHSDYHSNINLQMNYWLAEPANLAECHLPLINLTKEMCEPSRRATRKAFGDVRGFTYRTSHNIFGGHGWQWNIPASAWYMQHLREHYAFSQDKQYLKDTLYPMLKEVVMFWDDHLKALPDGTLVVPDGWSPEHGPREDGVAHDQQIVWDLFSNYVEAAEALGVDSAYQKKIAAMKRKLLGPKIGKWGQLQEWVEDRDDPKDQHRHTSHLFAVYPGRQISLIDTPEFANAAMISLKARGDSGDSRRSWTWSWRCALWARFHKGQECYRMIRGLLEYNMLNNLLATHPPLQLDGSFGITAGMCEMFLQSQTDVLELLPAIPDQWPAGSINGLRGRGGYEVDIAWEDGKLSGATIRATVEGVCKVQANVPFTIAGVSAKSDGNHMSFKAKAGRAYKIVVSK